MTSKSANLGIIHKLLMVFIAISIIGEVGNVIAWWAIPSMQISLNGGTLNGVTSPASILSQSVGSQNALIIGSILLLAIAAAYAYSFIALKKADASSNTNYSHLHRKPNHRIIHLRHQ